MNRRVSSPAVFVATTALLLITTVGNVSAASCTPKNAAELHKLLVHHSPFKGKWSYGNLSGPAEVRVRGSSWRNPYVVVRGSNKAGQLGPPLKKTATLNPPVTIQYRYNGAIYLRLSENCWLSGIQRYVDGSRVRLNLRPMG